MNLRLIRKKIKSITNVKKITKAMQMVSAVKMKKSQQEAKEGMPYRNTLEEMIQEVIKKINPKYSPLLQQNEPSLKRLIIAISPNKGLCGSYNSNLFRYLITNINTNNDIFITVGKKVSLFLTQIGATVVASFTQTPLIDNTSAIFRSVIDKFLNQEVSSVNLVFNHFINSFRSEPIIKQILPIKLVEKTPISEKPEKLEYKLEPKPEKLINPLLESYVEEQIKGAILENEAGEHSARMMAMKNATDNAQEVIYNLTLLRNKVRQEKITYELLDMVTAKESIEVKN